MPPKKSAPKPPIGKREERYLACSRCDLSFILSVNDERPTHHCRPIHAAAPFDIDLPSHRAPKTKWFEEKPKHPRPPEPDGRPRILL